MMALMRNTRRDFIRAGAAAGCGLGLAGVARSGFAGADRPNVLLILVDQDRGDLRLPVLKRPNLDRIRSSGLEFKSAYCAYPLCSPSRTTIMTGRYPHQAAVFANIDFIRKTQSLDPKIPNLGGAFSQAGYQTAYFGKWHLTRGAHNHQRMSRYGFSEMHVSNEAVAAGSDARVLSDSAKWIRARKGNARPWMCIASPINPHDICFPALAAFYGKIPEYPVALPQSFIDDPGEIYSEFGRYLTTSAIKTQRPKTPESWKRYLDFYCHLIEQSDRGIGVLLDALAESGQDENTIVIYTSDHGEMGGAHGLVNKGMAMYEENLRVPLVIRHPESRAPRTFSGPVSNADLAPTLCGLTGVNWPEPLPGFDLSPLCFGKEIARPSLIFAEGKTEYEGASPWRGIRTPDWKYWRYADGFEFLVELQNDPQEMTNLARDNAFKEIKQELREKLRRFQIDTNDPLLAKF